MKNGPILLLCIFLGACGGGGDDGGNSGPLQSLGGLYTGTTVSAGVTGEAIGIISEDGDMRLFDSTNRLLFVGKLQSNGQTFSGEVKGFGIDGRTFCNNQTIANAIFSGSGQSRNSLDGTFLAPCGDATVSLDYDKVGYETPSSISAIAGNYSVNISGVSETLTINSTGQITVSSQTGSNTCSGSGITTLIDARFNAYKISFTASCSTGTFGYSGLASIFPATGGNSARLLAFFGNATEAVYRVYVRQN